MGRSNTFQCPGCNYEVMTSAGPAAGMIAATNTFVCSDCKIVEDIVVKRYGRLRIQSEQSFGNKEIEQIKCGKCGGINLTEWDNKMKPCPKCGANMKISNQGYTIFWD